MPTPFPHEKEVALSVLRPYAAVKGSVVGRSVRQMEMRSEDDGRTGDCGQSTGQGGGEDRFCSPFLPFGFWMWGGGRGGS